MGIREEQYQQRKEQILQIALEEFINKGYFGTSTREIAKIAGISSGLMFHYFSSKQELYEFLVEVGCSEMTLEYTDEDDPLALLESRLSQTLQLISTNPFVGKMFVFMGDASYNAARISPKAGEMIAQHNVIEQSVPLIKRGQEQGQIREGDPKVLSIAFWCALQGIAESITLSSDMLVPKTEWIMDILRSKGL